MKYIVVDLEMNPVPRRYKLVREICKNETIQIGAICLDEAYREIDHFSTYVHPAINPEISRKIEELTHITTGMVQGAPSFTEAIEMFFEWCRSFEDDVRIMQWSETDYSQICSEMKLCDCEISTEARSLLESGWVDLQEEFGIRVGKNRKTSLSEALMLMGVEFQGDQHNALYDARNEAEIWRTLENPEECQKMLGKVMEALHETPFAFTIGDAIDLAAFGLSA